MATGKTEVGRRLARRLGRPFVDIDGLVEAASGKKVADIFASEGEARFRQLERAAGVGACLVPEGVVATGGGTLLAAENRRRLAAAGPIVCLAASPEEILRRVGDPRPRPLLAGGSAGGDRLARIRQLLAERAPAYALATHAVDTSGLSVDEVVERVRALVAGRGGGGGAQGGGAGDPRAVGRGGAGRARAALLPGRGRPPRAGGDGGAGRRGRPPAGRPAGR